MDRSRAESMHCPTHADPSWTHASNLCTSASPAARPKAPLSVIGPFAPRANTSRLGLTGKRWLIDSEVYPEKLRARGLEYMCPDSAERDEIDRIIMDELVYGVVKPEAIETFQRVMARMRDACCDALVLGCTEIPLIMHDTNSPLPTLDSTRLLARAALYRAVNRTAG
jgi:aspartate racemase